MGKKITKLILAILILFSHTAWTQDLKVFFLDVGEGEAIYFETAKHKILVDSGNLITGLKVVKFLKKRGVDQLDALIITHPHPDHMGGIFHVVQQIDIKARFDNGQSLSQEKDDLYRWYIELFRNNNYQALSAGDQLQFGDIKLQVLSPNKLSGNWNQDSLVIKVIHNDITLLLMADAGIATENKLLNSKVAVKADILKIGHHGSLGTSSADFLDSVLPKYAVISTNKNNLRGYPNKQVIKRINQKNIQLFYTYKHGDIVFKSDGNKVIVIE